MSTAPQLDAIESLVGRALAALPAASDDEICAYEAELEVDARRERLDASGILPVLTREDVERVTRQRCREVPALIRARGWWQYQAGPQPAGPKTTLGLLGSMGVGKTVAAASLLAIHGGRYVESEEVCRMQAARWGDERAAFQRLMTTRLLVIDEVGTEENAGRAKAALHDVINRRQSRLTLLLGNVTRADLVARLDPRTVDRLRACGHMIELAGESMRKGAL